MISYKQVYEPNGTSYSILLPFHTSVTIWKIFIFANRYFSTHHCMICNFIMVKYPEFDKSMLFSLIEYKNTLIGLVS